MGGSQAFSHRVAKCHGYGGYIRLKKLEGWGKKSGRIYSFSQSSIVLGKFEQLILNSFLKTGLYDRMFPIGLWVGLWWVLNTIFTVEPDI